MGHSTTCERVNEATDQLGTTAGEAMRGAQETAREWAKKAETNLESLSKAASDYVEQGQQKAQEFGRTVSGQVQRRPMSALLAAVGLGFLFGVVWNRR